MREIQLTHGFVAIVDDADYDVVVAVGPWFAHVLHPRHRLRSALCPRFSGKRRKRTLQHFLLGLSDAKIEVKHLDGDGLHCFRDNLRNVGATPRPKRGFWGAKSR
jgi:hypothetical protein